MNKFKVGQKVRVISCQDHGKPQKAENLTITSCAIGLSSPYKTARANCGCDVWRASELAPAGLDYLAVGDLIRDEQGGVFEVASVHDNVVDLADEDGHFNESLTIKELKDNDWTVVGEEEDTVEVTREEVAKKMGISVEKLRIKE